MTSLSRLEARLLCAVTSMLTGVTARGAVPDDSDKRTFVFFANHSSHLDAVVLWLSLPPTVRACTRPVAARDYWERTRLRRHLAARVLNALLVDRGRGAGDGGASLRAVAEGLETMVAALAAGSSLVIFPEGTRGTGEDMGHFRSGLYQLARRCPDAVFAPVYLENLNRILPKGEWLPVPLFGGVHFGEALQLAPDETKTAFLDRCWQALNGLRARQA